MNHYSVKHPSRSEFVTVRGQRLHCRLWGDLSKPKLFMLHGWMDVGASFQFVVDALQSDWCVIAPDWRGFGLSDWPVAQHGAGRSYWFPDYLIDLDGLLNHYSPQEPVHLIGHSMGANISLHYAGLWPERVRSLVDLEGFGLPDTPAEKAPAKLRTWMKEVANPPTLRPYESLEQVAGRLKKTNYRLSDAKALFLAQHWSRQREDGLFELLGDPAHRIASPFLYKLAEAQAVWAEIQAPVLYVEALQTEAALFMFRPGETVDFQVIRDRFKVIKNWRQELIDQAGHMVHHDQPEILANLIEGHCQ